VTGDEPEELSTKGEAVLSTLTSLWIFKISQSATAPEKIRTDVKVAGSMLLPFNAARHKSELLAKAIIANSVRMKIGVDFTRLKLRAARFVENEVRLKED
jgi:hypothetical protein